MSLLFLSKDPGVGLEERVGSVRCVTDKRKLLLFD